MRSDQGGSGRWWRMECTIELSKQKNSKGTQERLNVELLGEVGNPPSELMTALSSSPAEDDEEATSGDLRCTFLGAILERGNVSGILDQTFYILEKTDEKKPIWIYIWLYIRTPGDADPILMRFGLSILFYR